MIIDFSQETSIAVVGCKGHNLARMWQAGLSVPAGFCVASDGMDSLNSDLNCALQRLESPAFAVRSSAIQEDDTHDSFAGILVSRLNIKSAEGVLAALWEIRKSTLAAAAASYSRRRNVPFRLRIAAIVQRFIPAEASGVLFMRDPVSGADQIVVEGCWGLGPGTVEGLVRPDRWVLSTDGRVVSSYIGDKDAAVVPNENGGTTHVHVDAARRRRPCLPPASLAELFRLAVECERLFEGPQDIEWAVAADDVWLLQSRPITSGGRM